MKKYKSYSLINLLGLAVGLACVFMIYLFVFDEISYDRFYPQSKNIYRVGVKGKMGERILNYTQVSAPVGPNMLADFPDVKNFVRIYFSSDVLCRKGDKSFTEDDFIQADSTFFEIFPRPFLYGDSKTALCGSNKLVMSASAAQKYFGKENPIGESMEANGDLYTVSAVVEDVPANSHFHYDFIIPLQIHKRRVDNWFVDYLRLYLLLDENAEAEDLEKKFEPFVEKHMGPLLVKAFGISIDAWKKSGNTFGYILEPLEDIYLKSKMTAQVEPVSDIKYVYVFSLVAFLILLLACVNFLNLNTARSFTRSREVGVRKVFGSHRLMILFQFYIETFIMVFVATIIACFMLELLLPLFNQITQKEILTSAIWRKETILFIILILLLVVFFSGSYTAFSLSNFNMMKVLKGELQKGKKGQNIRLVLVVVQFTIAIVILLSAFVIKQQVNYMQNKKLGFDREQVLVVDNSDELTLSQCKMFKEKLQKCSFIESVSSTSILPGRTVSGRSMLPEGVSSENLIFFKSDFIDENFVDVFNIKLKEGRNFERQRLSDTAVILVNQQAIKTLGYDEKAIERYIYSPGIQNQTRKPYKIVGMVEDFHFESMKEQIAPLLLIYEPRDDQAYFAIKFKGDNLLHEVEQVNAIWNEITHQKPFDYFFFDDDFNRLFKSEIRVSVLLSVFTFLAFFIALLGLLGLVSFELQQRVKEIGIRKVLGSSELSIMILLGKKLTLSVFIANLIAWPITFISMNYWLSNFAYRIDFPWYFFVLAFLISTILSVLTVGSHTLRVNRISPMIALKYE